MLRIIRVPTKPFCCAALSVNSTTPGSEAESNGFSFQIASWDWDVAAGWFWDCDSDDFVVYEDPDHDGWYMLYNVHTGQYVHVMYMGSCYQQRRGRLAGIPFMSMVIST